MLNIGMVGVWHVHTDDYFKQAQKLDGVSIVAVWDEDAQAGKAWADAHDLPFEPSLDALLAREDIQAIICDTPTTAHPQVLAKAAAAGKHIYTEKLLATTTQDALALCDAIEAAGIVATVSLPLLTNPTILFARKLLDEKKLGRVTGARMRRSHSGVSDGWLPERWFDVSKSGGGALMDLGAHPVYVLNYLLGQPQRISGMLANLYGTSSDENAIALVTYENGVLATCETAFVTYGVPDLLEIYGTEGSVFIRGNTVSLNTKGTKQEITIAPETLPQPLPGPLAQFVDACINGKASPANLTPRDALTMTKVIESAYKSDASGETITL